MRCTNRRASLQAPRQSQVPLQSTEIVCSNGLKTVLVCTNMLSLSACLSVALKTQLNLILSLSRSLTRTHAHTHTHIVVMKNENVSESLPLPPPPPPLPPRGKKTTCGGKKVLGYTKSPKEGRGWAAGWRVGVG